MTMIRAILLLFLFAASAEAATLTEAKIACASELYANMDDGAPHVFVACQTLDAQGNVIRSQRQIDITARLTAQQRAGILAILQSLPGNAAAAVGIPTPNPTSTP